MSIEYDGLKVFTAKEVRQMPNAKTSYWVDPLIPKGGKTLVVGKSQTGKSHFIVQMASCTVCEEDFLIWPTEPCCILYLSLDKRLLSPMVRRVTAGLDENALDALKLVKWEALEPLYLDVPKSKNLAYTKLEKLLESIQPQILILDPKVGTFKGDENSVEDTVRWIENVERLRSDHHLTIVVIHHTPKGVRSTELIDSPRGSGALAGWADVIIGMKRKNKEIRTVEVVSHYEEEIEPLEFYFNGRFSLEGQEPETQSKLKLAKELINNLWETTNPTEMVRKVSVEVGTSTSYVWQALKQVREERV